MKLYRHVHLPFFTNDENGLNFLMGQDRHGVWHTYDTLNGILTYDFKYMDCKSPEEFNSYVASGLWVETTYEALN